MLYTNHETFLSELTKLFEACKHNGKSVWITMKRYDGRRTRNPRKPNDRPKRGSKTPVCQSGDLMPSEHKCLIRAKLGDKKISVVVSQKEINKFQLCFSNIVKSNLTGIVKKPQKL